jgi:hypothetical protein
MTTEGHIYVVLCQHNSGENYIVTCDLAHAPQAVEKMHEWGRNSEMALTMRDAVDMAESLVKQMIEGDWK